MSKVVFSKVSGRMMHPEYGMHHSHDFIACDLARPASELAAIGALMSSVAWVGETMVIDGMLYVRSDYNTPYLLEERALYQVLSVARAVLSEGVEVVPAERIKPSPRPEVNDDVYCSRPSAYVRNANDPHRAVKYAVPADTREPAMMVVERDGRFEGHLLVSERYDSARKDLAVHLIDMFAPEAGIEIADRQVYEEMYLTKHVEGIEDLGAACLRVAGGMVAAMKDRMHKLPFEGRPSAFLDEDNDARDVLLSLMAAGATLERTPIEDDPYDFSGTEPTVRYHLDDGTEMAYHIVQRLRKANCIHASDGKWGESSTFVAAEGLRRSQLQPRAETVSFDMFQSACRYRRHPDDGEIECVSPDRGGCSSYCDSEYCPLLDRVYENEYGDDLNSHRTMEEDPAFEYHVLDERPDPLMVARHRNTKRSYAWRYAGQSRMHGILNQVLGAHFTYGIPMLVEAMHDAAVDQAVAEGWLALDERNVLGSVARVTDKLLGEIERQRQERQAAMAVPTDA